MKEFESWNKLRGVDFRIRFSPPRQFEAYIEHEREDAWEAALEWALVLGRWKCIAPNIREELKGTEE